MMTLRMLSEKLHVDLGKQKDMLKTRTLNGTFVNYIDSFRTLTNE